MFISFSSFPLDVDDFTILMWCIFHAHTDREDFQAGKCRKSQKYKLLFMWTSLFRPQRLLSCALITFLEEKNASTSILKEKHFPTEWTTYFEQVKVFPFTMMSSFFLPPRCLFPRSGRIINGRKLRKLCNIFIKFFAVACNFYDGAMLRIQKTVEDEIKGKLSRVEANFIKRELIAILLGLFIFILHLVEL